MSVRAPASSLTAAAKSQPIPADHKTSKPAASAAVSAATAPAIAAAGNLSDAKTAALFRRWQKNVDAALEACAEKPKSTDEGVKDFVLKNAYALAKLGGKLDGDLGTVLKGNPAALELRRKLSCEIGILEGFSRAFPWGKTVLKPLIFCGWKSYYRFSEAMVRAVPKAFKDHLPDPSNCFTVHAFDAAARKNVLTSVLYLSYISSAINFHDLGEGPYLLVSERIADYIALAEKKFSREFVFTELVPLLEDYKAVEAKKDLKLHPLQIDFLYRQLPTTLGLVKPRVVVGSAGAREDLKTAAIDERKDCKKGAAAALNAPIFKEAGELLQKIGASEVPKDPDAFKRYIAEHLFSLGDVADRLFDQIQNRGFGGEAFDKAKKHLGDLRIKIWDLFGLAAKYAQTSQHFYVEDVVLPVFKCFRCIHLPSAFKEVIVPLPSAFVKNLSDPSGQLLTLLMMEGSADKQEAQLLYDLHNLLVLREEIKILDFKVPLHRSAYLEINRRVTEYLKLCADLSFQFLLDKVMPLVDSPHAQGVKLGMLPLPTSEILAWKAALFTKADTAAGT
jgi:hypothetical protein